MNQPIDIVLRNVPVYGWLPILVGNVDGEPREIYRGEFRSSPKDAFERASSVLRGDVRVHDVEAYLGRS